MFADLKGGTGRDHARGVKYQRVLKILGAQREDRFAVLIWDQKNFEFANVLRSRMRPLHLLFLCLD